MPIWYAPFEEEFSDDDAYPLHALTQRPMAMYHSWGSQNAWLRQIHGWNKLYVSSKAADSAGLEDDDWAWLESPYGRIKAQIKRMEGCNEATVWTWNAIGKRRGAWNLEDDAPESRRGFLLNHLITDLLPPKNGHRYANADPITGQAAWFDLRVRLTKADPEESANSEPQFDKLETLPGVEQRPAILRYGARFLPSGSWRRQRGGS